MYNYAIIQRGARKKIINRAEGRIEPLSYYNPTDLKSAHNTSYNHPRLIFVSYTVHNNNTNAIHQILLYEEISSVL